MLYACHILLVAALYHWDWEVYILAEKTSIKVKKHIEWNNVCLWYIEINVNVYIDRGRQRW